MTGSSGARRLSLRARRSSQDDRLPSFLCRAVQAQVFTLAHAVYKSAGSGHVEILKNELQELFWKVRTISLK